jgi:prevent-host-death family protein
MYTFIGGENMSTITVSLTQLRPKFPQILDRVTKYFDRYVITRHGKPEAVVLAEEDYESLLETLEILSDKKLIRELKKARAEMKAGKGIPWNKVKKKLGYV